MKFLTKELPTDSYLLALEVEKLMAARRELLDFRDQVGKISAKEIAIVDPSALRKAKGMAEVSAELTCYETKFHLKKILQDALTQIGQSIDEDLKAILTPGKAAENK